MLEWVCYDCQVCTTYWHAIMVAVQLDVGNQRVRGRVNLRGISCLRPQTCIYTLYGHKRLVNYVRVRQREKIQCSGLYYCMRFQPRTSPSVQLCMKIMLYCCSDYYFLLLPLTLWSTFCIVKSSMSTIDVRNPC